MKDKLMGFLFGEPDARKKEQTPQPPPQPPLPPPVATTRQLKPEPQPQPSREEMLKSLAAINEALNAKPEPQQPKPVPADPATKERVKDRSLYEALLTGLYDGVLIFDARGYVIGSNKRAQQFFGYDPTELWNMACDQLIPALSIRVLLKIKNYAESGRFTVVNASCTRKDGSTFPSEIAISRINLLNEGDLILSIRNLERREKARQRHELELEALRWAGSGIIVCDLSGMIEYANPAFIHLLRFQEEKDVLKRFIGEFCTSYEAANALLHSPSAQCSWEGKLEIRTADDKSLEVLAVASISDKQHDNKAFLVVTLTPLPTIIR